MIHDVRCLLSTKMHVAFLGILAVKAVVLGCGAGYRFYWGLFPQDHWHQFHEQRLQWVKQLIGMTAMCLLVQATTILRGSFFMLFHWRMNFGQWLDSKKLPEKIPWYHFNSWKRHGSSNLRNGQLSQHPYLFRPSGWRRYQAAWSFGLANFFECFKLHASKLDPRRQAQKDFIACGLAWELPFQASLIQRTETNLQCIAWISS